MNFGISDFVIRAGYIPDADLVGLYNTCALFVFPSLHEGFGLPALEAMSCGAPVIGSDTTSIPEVIGNKDALFDPTNSNSIAEKIIQVLKSGFWASGSGIGNVKSFEEKFQQYIGSKSCVAVNSGTAALHLALSLSDIKGKEVILPSLSFVSTAHSIVYNGGKPVFADIDPKTLCIDPEKVLKKISSRFIVIFRDVTNG